jgi:DNA-binding CsgD family transcriptional regulator
VRNPAHLQNISTGAATLARDTTDLDAYSELIGSIYDCAIDAQSWPRAIERIADLMAGANGVILMIDTVTNQPKFYVDWNTDPELMKRYREEFHADNPMYAAFSRFEQDKAYNVPSAMDVNDYLNSRVHRDFGAPQGWLDGIGVNILKTPTRTASLSFARWAAAGWAGPRELKILSLLSPHVRRAVSIADLIEMRSLRAATFETTLDGLSVPVILVDQSAHVVHANVAAHMLLAEGGPLKTQNGILRAADPTASGQLEAAIAQTAQPEWYMGKIGIDLVLPYADGRPGCAHILPLGSGSIRGSIAGKATAAMFFAPTSEPFRPPIEAWTSAYGFTQAETKVLEQLIAGKSVAEIADGLAVSEATVRTHVAKLLSKTGVSRQAELIKLAQRMSPPVRIQ